ncbi:MAG: hypothetical protein R6V03_07005 [Kiritimatiellia bacterium]
MKWLVCTIALVSVVGVGAGIYAVSQQNDRPPELNDETGKNAVLSFRRFARMPFLSFLPEKNRDSETLPFPFDI